MKTDHAVGEDILKAEAPPELPKETVVSAGATKRTSSGENSGAGGITFVQSASGAKGPSPQTTPLGSPRSSAGECRILHLLVSSVDFRR